MKQTKVEHSDVVACRGANAQLYLAQKEFPSEWLSSDDEDIDRLLDGDPVIVATYTYCDNEANAARSRPRCVFIR